MTTGKPDIAITSASVAGQLQERPQQRNPGSHQDQGNKVYKVKMQYQQNNTGDNTGTPQYEPVAIHVPASSS